MCFNTIGDNRKAEDTQVAIFLHGVGEDALEVSNTFDFKNEENNKKNLKGFLKNFAVYFNPRKNTLFERCEFWKYDGETIDQFVEDLKKMIKKNEYKEPADSMIRDR